MRYLCQGLESRTKMNILIEFTKYKTNYKMRNAFLYHFTDNYSVTHAAILAGVKDSNLSRGITKLNKMAELNEQLFELKVNYQLSDNK